MKFADFKSKPPEGPQPTLFGSFFHLDTNKETIALCEGVCPTCGGDLATTFFVQAVTKKEKIYYQCKKDEYHYFYRDRMVDS